MAQSGTDNGMKEVMFEQTSTLSVLAWNFDFRVPVLKTDNFKAIIL